MEATTAAGAEQPQSAAAADTADAADVAEALPPEAVIETASPSTTSAPLAADLPEIVQDLDNRQRLALVSLARGSNMTKACADAGVGRTTLYRWINEDARFSAAYNRWKAVCQLSAHGQVLALQDLAAEVLRENLEFKRDGKLAARILEKTGALAPPSVGPTHPGRAAAHITADQREQDARAAKHVEDADHAIRWIPNEFRFSEKDEKPK